MKRIKDDPNFSDLSKEEDLLYEPGEEDEEPEDGEAAAAALLKRRSGRNIPAIIVGVLTTALAVYGLYSLIALGLGAYLKNREEKKLEAYEFYYSYLIPAAAIDIEPFEDVTTASMSELVEMSVWALLNAELDPAKFDYEGDELIIPQSQVEASYLRYFGAERPIVHCTVQGYGYEFAYDEASFSYRIPLTTITPVYTPVITESEAVGNSVVLTVGLQSVGMYEQDPKTGALKAPEPDKYLRVTLRNVTSGWYISSVLSSGIPEIA